VTLADLTPRGSEYVEALRMMATPAIAITVLVGMMVHIGNNIQGTFYVVWLNEVANIPGTLIGTLISISSAGAILGSLIAAPMRRWFRPYWILWFVILMATVLITVTPLLGAYVAFAVVLSLRAVFTGMHQPLVVTLMLRTVGPNDKGKAIGLRGTANRITSIAAPFLFGAVAQLITDATGNRVLALEWSFYIIGGLACALMFLIAWRMTKYPEIHEIAQRGRTEAATH
jgi:predicted MFS family arabinose efflux permease